MQRQLRREHREYVHNLLNDPTEETSTINKRFWTYVKHRRSECGGLTALRVNNMLVTDSKLKADALNQQFQSVFSAKTNNNKAENSDLYKTDMRHLHVGREGVLKLLRELKTNKATGPDGVSARLLKESAESIADTLVHIFNTSLQNGEVPKDWKEALVTPIYKKGDRFQCANYRPVSLTCIASKMLEHIVACHLMRFLSHHNLLYSKQHGFRPRLSCETQLIELISDISNSLDKGHEIDACLLDFSKAFDKVNHSKLLYKMKMIGVSQQIVRGTDSFLHNRSQRVALDGKSSESCEVTSGVPQGSVVGPILFLIYINDLPLNAECDVRLFADDTIVYTNTNNDSQLQMDLNSLEQWEADWDMHFNPSKCEVIRFSRKKKPAVQRVYTLHDENIPHVSTIKYLGVKIQSDLRWNAHIDYTTSKASSTLGFIKRTIPPQSTTLRARAYKQLIRPILEYASCSFDPLPKTQATKLEASQRRAARAVFNIPRISHTSTTALLNKLQWEPLSDRRLNRRLAMFRAMHFGEIGVDIEPHVKPSTARVTARRHNQQYAVTHHNTKAHMSTFFIDTSKKWNQLGCESRLLCSPG